MLVIRLLRKGKKHQPSYRVVVVDSRRAPQGGRFVDEVGFWNPLTKQKRLDAEKIKNWILKGAQPSDTVYNMLISEKIVEGKKVDVHKKSKKETKPEETKPEEAKPEEAKPEEAKPESEEKKEVKENQPKAD